MDEDGTPRARRQSLRTPSGVRPELRLSGIAILFGAWLTRGSRMLARPVSTAGNEPDGSDGTEA